VDNSVSDGGHNVVVWCNDTLGNMNTSETIYFTVDTAGPLYSSNVTDPASPVTYAPGASYQFNITWTDATTDVDTVLFEFNGNNYSVSQDGNVYYIILPELSANVTGHEYKWYANDSANNWNSTVQLNYIINKADPSSFLELYLQEVAGNVAITYPTASNATGSSTLVDNQDLTLTLYRNETLQVGIQQ